MRKWFLVSLTLLFVSSLYPQFFGGASGSGGNVSAFGGTVNSSFGTQREFAAGQAGAAGISMALEIGAGGDITNIDPEKYVVKAGDTFFIRYMTERIFTTVFPTGVLSLYPFTTDIVAAGKTVAEVYREVYSKLPEDLNRENILVEFFQIAPTSYYIFGAVVTSGQYYVSGTISLMSAIDVAGGFMQTASRVLTVVRNGEELVYDLSELYINKNTEINPYLQNDDIIIVNFAENFVRVFSNSNEVECIEIKDGENLKVSDIFIRLTKKVASTRVEAVTIFRDGKYSKVDNDFIIKPGDRVYLDLEELFVYVTGNVNSPGRISYQGINSVHFYISQAGGPDANGSTSRVLIINSKGKYVPYEGQHIQPGDIIFVPETWRSIMTSYLGPISSLLSVISSILILTNRI